MDPVKQKKRLTILFVLLPIDMVCAVMLPFIIDDTTFKGGYDFWNIIALLGIVVMSMMTAVVCVLTFRQLKIKPENRVKASPKFWIPILIVAFGYALSCMYDTYKWIFVGIA